MYIIKHLIKIISCIHNIKFTLLSAPHVYKNEKLIRSDTLTHPTFLGPLFIHGASKTVDYAIFLSHLSLILDDSTFEYVIGTDDEAALVSAIPKFFRRAKRVLCTRQ